MTRPVGQRYNDAFLNALMYPHQATSRGELLWAGTKMEDLTFISGTVSGDRGATVRRTFQANIDPRCAPRHLSSPITPYGGQIRVWRGIRFPNGDHIEVPIFFGRIDLVDWGRDQISVRCQDLAAAMVDARFEVPITATRGWRVYDQIKALIQDVDASFVVNNLTTSTENITTPATWDRERVEALDNLAQGIGAEWYAGVDGQFYIQPLPAITSDPAVWVIDSGDEGVVITRQSQLDRARVYNAVVVNGEPPDGTPPAYGVVHDDNPDSLTRWGGPFGKVPRFFSSQFITTNAQALATAQSMLGDAIAGTRGVSVSCVPNPKLNLGDVVLLQTGAGDFDGMYFVNTLNLSMEPETPMTLGLNLALEADDNRFLRGARRRVPPEWRL